MDEVKQINFNEIYTKFYRKSFLFTKSYVQDDLIAEDIASESLIKLWEVMRKEEVQYPKVFLFKILKNKSLDYLKREGVQSEAYSSIADYTRQELQIRISSLQACDPDVLFSKELQQLINEALEKLPPQTRKVFEMSRFGNHSNREIADSLQISVKGVEYHITNALKVMRVHLKDYLPLLHFLFLIN